MNKVRLNKFLSDAGVCSRREADRAVEAGEVTVNGEPAVMGQKITEIDEVCFRGRPVRRKAADDFVLLAVNKREGIVCTTSRKDPDTWAKTWGDALDNFMKFCIQKATGVDLDKLIGNNDKLRT